MHPLNIDFDQLSRWGAMQEQASCTKIVEPTQIDLLRQDLKESMGDNAIDKLIAVIESLQKRLDQLEGKNANH